MGIFESLSSGYFQTTPDGRRLFFPWGALGRGYVVASDQDYKRLQLHITIYMIATVVLMLGSIISERYVAAFAIAMLLFVFYAFWARFVLVRGLQPTDERLRLKEAMIAQAIIFGAAALWLLEFTSLALAGLGVFVLVIDPAEWPMAAACIAMFGAVAAFVAYMIILRRQGLAARGR